MKFFADGDQLVITKDSFVDLQESAVVFYPLTSEVAQTVLQQGLLYLPLGVLRDIKCALETQVQEAIRAAIGKMRNAQERRGG